MTTIRQDTPPAVPTTSELKIVLDEQLIVGNRQLLKQRVLDAVYEGATHIVLDASRVGYIDTSGLGVLLSITRRCQEHGCTLAIDALCEEMRVWLETIHLDEVLPLTPARIAA